MRVLEAGDWSLLLPDEWQAEQDEDSIVIGDQDDVGCIEISELRKERGAFAAADLEALIDNPREWNAAQLGSFSGRRHSLIEDDAAIREWYVYTGDLLLYITYSCALENRGLDDAVVDEILATLQAADPG
jgi:hypothetical protein